MSEKPEIDVNLHGGYGEVTVRGQRLTNINKVRLEANAGELPIVWVGFLATGQHFAAQDADIRVDEATEAFLTSIGWEKPGTRS